jgi:thiamine-phosphate pyrophosphorylase
MPDSGFLRLSRLVLKVTRRFGVPLIINDSVYVAARSGAEGAHVGDEDMDVKAARKILGTGKIIGVSASTYAGAIKGGSSGADYIGLGPVYRTENKETRPLPRRDLVRLMKKLRLPVVAIGGIKEYNIPRLKKSGVKNFCFISEISGAKNIRVKAARLKELINDPA